MLQIRPWASVRGGPWNTISCDWDGGPTLRSILFEIPDQGLHLFTVRAQLYRVRKAATVRAKAPGESWKSEPSPATTVAQFLALFSDHAAAIDATFGRGFARAVSVLASDPRLHIDCLGAVLGAGSSVARRNRAQALLEFPLLVPILTMQKPAGLRMEFMPDKIAAAIDHGYPLIPALVDTFECRPWVWKRLRKRVAAEIEPYTSLRELVDHIGELPPERAPTPRGFWLLAYLYGSQVGRHPWVQEVAKRSVIRSGWPEFGTRVTRVPQIHDYALFVEGLLTNLPEPHLPDRIGILDRALGSPTLAQLDTLSERWHRIEERLQPEAPAAPPVSDAPGVDSWRPLFKQPLSQGGLVFRCLSDRASLREEGIAMKHCVGSYANRCARGDSHIVSICRDNHKIATAELSLGAENGSIKVCVEQLSGVRNASCSPKTRQALLEVLGSLPQSHLATFLLPKPLPLEPVHHPDELVTQCFEDAVSRLGDEALLLYRPCLQLSTSKSALWEAVWRRFASVSHHNGCQSRATSTRI